MLRRISQKSGVVPPATAGAATASHIDVVRAQLPEELRAHLVNCLLRPGEVVLFADTAAWATRLRLAGCEAAAAGALAALPGVEVDSRITVRVTPPRLKR
ncbi:MAG TPA: hypothetical protein VN645_02455 [Steroidobacteraceae bacterium]|nr:hypothetical protein [Steroidobacteraceae bacterium]